VSELESPKPPAHLRTDDEPGQDRIRSLVEWAAVIVGALLVALLVKTFLFQAFSIPSGSMQPTLRPGDRVMVNKLSYRFGDIDRGDILVFERPANVPELATKDLIKRVIGLPGEVIELRDGVVHVDGQPLDEPYLPAGTRTDPAALGARIEVPEGHILVLGDNRGSSQDGRSFGPIDTDLVVGRAIARVWPIPDITRL
jgi:signal peptidase I